jgi:hypothetical protein
MEAGTWEHRGHRIELRAPATQARGDELELFVDGRRVPYGKFTDGKYALHERAFDAREDLVDLARRLIDQRNLGRGG